MKKQNGITLIALVITIIVLLILAGVSISLVVGNNGVLTQASSAVIANKEATAKEDVAMAWSSAITKYWSEWAGDATVNKSNYLTKAELDQYLPNGSLVEDPTYADGIYTVKYQKEGEVYTVLINESGNATLAGTSNAVSTPTTYPTYAAAQEVMVDGDQFFVLSTDDDETKGTVTLLAKYNLNQAGTAQAPDATDAETGVGFSSINYWVDDWALGEEYLIDLNTYPMPASETASNNAVKKAQAYATLKGGTNGRLLTHDEYWNGTHSGNSAEAAMFDGTYNHKGAGSSTTGLSYWIALTGADDMPASLIEYSKKCVYTVPYGAARYDYSTVYGVRPVITVPKSLVTPAE